VDPTRLGLDLTSLRAIVTRPTTGDLAHGREVSGIGLKGPKSVLLPLNSGCLGKADGSTNALSKCRFPIGYARIRRNALCQLHQRDVEIVRTHIDVGHLLNK
jgi:hypothetical protein